MATMSAHFFFPKDAWAELMAEGRIVPHPVFPDRQGPAARRIEDEEDVREVIELMRLNYDRGLLLSGRVRVSGGSCSATSSRRRSARSRLTGSSR
jgi:hypothetical protein